MYKGFTKAWRRELESDLWLMPPIYHRVWYCLRQKVQHEKFLFPTNKKYGVWVLPGQRVTSYQEIAEWCKWSEWGREKVPNKKTIKSVLDYLKQEEMIAVEGNARGTLISIIKWDTYNNTTGGKGNAQVTPKGYKKRMLKNEEKEEEHKEPKTVTRFSPPSIQEVSDYCSERKNTVSPQRFIDHYESNGWKVGKNKMKAWKAAIRTWEANTNNNGGTHGQQQKPSKLDIETSDETDWTAGF